MRGNLYNEMYMVGPPTDCQDDGTQPLRLGLDTPMNAAFDFRG